MEEQSPRGHIGNGIHNNLVVLTGFVLSGQDYGLLFMLVFPTLDLMTDLIYFSMNDFARLELLIAMPFFIFVVPIIYLLYHIIQERVYIPSPFVWLKSSWKVDLRGGVLYFEERPAEIFDDGVINLFYCIFYWLLVPLAFIFQILFTFFTLLLYPVVLILWFLVGIILVQTKMLSINLFDQNWRETFLHYPNQQGQNRPQQIKNQVQLHRGALHLLIVLELITETSPQVILQTINNQELGVWSPISIISSVCSGILLLMEVYHYWYWLFWKKVSLEDVPFEKFKLSKDPKDSPKVDPKVNDHEGRNVVEEGKNQGVELIVGFPENGGML